MAKKDGKKKDKKGSGAADTVEAVRSAVERALPEGSRERGRELVDEVARAVTRVRESLEQHGVFDELGKLRGEVESLARRVASLERPGSPAKSTTSAAKAKSSATKRARSKTATSTATKAASTKSAATKRSATKRSATKRAATKRSGTKASATIKGERSKTSRTIKGERSKSSSTRSSGS